jgi:glycerophosphoryl diester phosphodiesterase
MHARAAAATTTALLGAAVLVLPTSTAHAAPDTDRTEVIAHRGASAYAPEHTRAAYELAIAQGADYIEPDLQITADSVLIALHDETLERTTNVAEVFPDRYVEEAIRMGGIARRWYAAEFTLEEIKTLDAGSWFDPEFAGERVPTLAEVIEIARGRAGIFPETKAPEVYGDRGFDMERLVVEELRRFGLDVPNGIEGTPVLLQSFSSESLRPATSAASTGVDLLTTARAIGPSSWWRAGVVTRPTVRSSRTTGSPCAGSSESDPSRCSSTSRRGGRPRFCTRATVSWPR